MVELSVDNPYSKDSCSLLPSNDLSEGATHETGREVTQTKSDYVRHKAIIENEMDA